MACDTSASSSDLSERSVDFIHEGDSENEERTLDALRQRRTKKLPARYVDAFQSDDEKLEVEMKDSKFF